MRSGEFEAPADLDHLVDRTIALLDGTGLRALLRDPAMDLERARRLAAEQLGGELGVDPEELIAPKGALG